jgi:hypothetical protein
VFTAELTEYTVSCKTITRGEGIEATTKSVFAEALAKIG